MTNYLNRIEDQFVMTSTGGREPASVARNRAERQEYAKLKNKETSNGLSKQEKARLAELDKKYGDKPGNLFNDVNTHKPSPETKKI